MDGEAQLREAELEQLRAEQLACTQRSRVLKREIRLRVAELEELERRITEIDRVEDHGRGGHAAMSPRFIFDVFLNALRPNTRRVVEVLPVLAAAGAAVLFIGWAKGDLGSRAAAAVALVASRAALSRCVAQCRAGLMACRRRSCLEAR